MWRWRFCGRWRRSFWNLAWVSRLSRGRNGCKLTAGITTSTCLFYHRKLRRLVAIDLFYVVDHITNLLWLISLCGVRLIYRDQTEKTNFFAT